MTADHVDTGTDAPDFEPPAVPARADASSQSPIANGDHTKETAEIATSPRADSPRQASPMVDKFVQYDLAEEQPPAVLKSPEPKEVQTEPLEPAPETPAYAEAPTAAVSQSSEGSGEDGRAGQAQAATVRVGPFSSPLPCCCVASIACSPSFTSPHPPLPPPLSSAPTSEQAQVLPRRRPHPGL